MGKTAILFSDLKVSESKEDSYSLFTAKRSAFVLWRKGGAEEKTGEGSIGAGAWRGSIGRGECRECSS